MKLKSLQLLDKNISIQYIQVTVLVFTFLACLA